MKYEIRNTKYEKGLPRGAPAKWGMTVFIAVIIMSIMLLISFAVVNIAVKSSLFANSGRDSQYAFYGADAGLECALYWDSKFDSFATTTDGVPRTISCAWQPTTGSGSAISGTSTLARIGGGTDANPTSVFGFDLNSGSSANPLRYCAIVTVKKYYSGLNLMTYIKSRGYNTCDTSNPRRVERGVEVTY